MEPDASQVQAALTCLVICAGLGWFAPPLIARLPEPQPEPQLKPTAEPEVEAESEREHADGSDRKLFARTLPPPTARGAARPRGRRTAPWAVGAAWSAAVGAAFGLALGWTGALLYLVPLAPIGVVLMIIDWRTTLLPTRILHPTYVLVAVLIPLAALVDHDLGSLYRAGWGWLVIGGWFWIFWWLFTAWGFGDVRLARVLGPALGYLGWSQMMMGLVLILFVGAIGGLVMAGVRGSLRARVPYGPSMLAGALLAVLIGPWLAQSLGY